MSSDFLKGFTGSHRFVLDYLIEEVLSQQKPEILQFLLRTSILEHLTASLCDRVVDKTDSQAILVRLEKSNMFLVSLDDERCWYRYHPLFADMLNARLRQTYPEIIPALHSLACTWYTDNGSLSKALTHALAAGDLDRLVKLVEKYVFNILDSHDASTFLNWLNSLPDSVTGSSPWLNIAQAWLLAYLGQAEGIETAILAAEKHSDHADLRLWGYIAAMRTLLAEFNSDTTQGIPHARQAFELLPQDEYRPRAFVSYHLSNLLSWQGDILPALKALDDASTWSLAARDYEMAMTAQFEKANILHYLGRLAESLRTYENTFQLADSGFPDKITSLSVGFAYLQMSALYLEWDHTAEALRYAREGIQICRLWGYSDYLYNGLANLSSALFANGDLDGALSTIREAKQIFHDKQSVNDRMGAFEAEINLARGDLDTASTWAENSGLSPNDNFDVRHFTEYYHFSSVLMAQGRLLDAYGILERFRIIMEKTGVLTSLLRVLTQQIIILHTLKEDAKAFSLLQRALGMAEPEGYIRVFINQGAPMKEMLLKAAQLGLYPDFVSKLLGKYPEMSSPAVIAAIQPESTPSIKKLAYPLIETLSHHELKVLHLLNTALSVPEIAQELVVAPSTIRTHVRNIYSKLGVHNRIEAITKANELSLI